MPNLISEHDIEQTIVQRLPVESYDKDAFTEKRDNVLEPALHLGINGLRWAA